MTAATTPRRRRSDRGWRILIRENWYRDVILFVVSMILLLSLKAFQDERWNNVFNDCQTGNERYTNTIAELNRSIAEAPPARQREARANKARTIRFIVALVGRPHFDPRTGTSTCHAFADDRVSRWW